MQVFDGHNDTVLKLYRSAAEDAATFLDGRCAGDLDLARARAGGLTGGFFAAFVPPDPAVPRLPDDGFALTADGYTMPLPPPLDFPYARRVADELTDILVRIAATSAGRVRIVRSVADVRECLRAGVFAAILHFEGAEAIAPNLDNLADYYRAGLRSLGLVWSRPNAFAEGVPFRFPASPDTGPGLTTAGRALVRECNRLGILIDLSHLNERGFWDVAACSDAPLVATHSGAHALCPVTRNLTDRQLDAISATHGLVGVPFDVTMIRRDGSNDRDAPLDALIEQIDYLVGRVGLDGVGFGSDFDGAPILRPIGDAAGFPALLGALRDHGYSEAALQKLALDNWLRVLAATWKG